MTLQIERRRYFMPQKYNNYARNLVRVKFSYSYRCFASFRSAHIVATYSTYIHILSRS